MNQKDQIKALEDEKNLILENAREFYKKVRTEYQIMLNKYSYNKKEKSDIIPYDGICSSVINELTVLLCMYDLFDETDENLPF